MVSRGRKTNGALVGGHKQVPLYEMREEQSEDEDAR